MGGIRSADSKHAKYQTLNPISRFLVRRFLVAIGRCVVPLHPESVLDVGCGEGMVLRSLESQLAQATCTAVDLDPAEVVDAQRNLPGCQVGVASGLALPFGNNRFDLVICSEVLEHVEEPEKLLSELSRVSAKHVLVSVPREPIWRGLNMLRGAYLREWGNTTGHINHWSSRSFERFVETEFDILAKATPLPWTLLLGRKR